MELGKVMSLLFSMLSSFVIVLLLRSKRLLISWLQSPSIVILEPKKICLWFHFFSFYLSWNDGTRCHNLSSSFFFFFFFLVLSFRPDFSSSSFTLIKRFSSSSLSAITVVSSAYLCCWYFFCQSWFQPGISHDVLLYIS